MDTISPAGFQALDEKIRLHQGLATTEGDPAAGFIVEGLVLEDLFQHLEGGHLPSDTLTGSGRAHASTIPAAAAGPGVIAREGGFFAELDARAAPYAAFWHEGEFRLPLLAFGVVAPLASQRATFEENGGADAGAILDGIPLDVEDDSLSQRRPPPSIQ